MRGEVQSFGRRTPPPEQDQVLTQHAAAMPGMQLPVVLVVDPESMAEAAQQIQDMVVNAVRAGWEQAMSEFGPEGDAPVHAAAEPSPDQLADLAR